MQIAVIMADALPLSQCKLFYGATIITVNQRREIIRDGYIRVEGDRITAIGKCPYSEALPSDAREIDCRGKIIVPGLINTHAHLVQSLLRGLAEELPLHNWLCDAIWPLEAVFEGDDGFHAARLTMAEMLKTGTTCFLDPMLTYRAGFDQICAAVGEMGIRGCLVCSNPIGASSSLIFHFSRCRENLSSSLKRTANCQSPTRETVTCLPCLSLSSSNHTRHTTIAMAAGFTSGLRLGHLEEHRYRIILSLVKHVPVVESRPRCIVQRPLEIASSIATRMVAVRWSSSVMQSSAPSSKAHQNTAIYPIA